MSQLSSIIDDLFDPLPANRSRLNQLRSIDQLILLIICCLKLMSNEFEKEPIYIFLMCIIKLGMYMTLLYICYFDLTSSNNTNSC